MAKEIAQMVFYIVGIAFWIGVMVWANIQRKKFRDMAKEKSERKLSGNDTVETKDGHNYQIIGRAEGLNKIWRKHD